MLGTPASRYAVTGSKEVEDAVAGSKKVADSVISRKAAQRRQTFLTRIWCITNYCCLGRMYGRSLLQSGMRVDHPFHSDPVASKYLPMFSRMSLSIRSIETLFEVFQLIDKDSSGEIDVDEFLFFFRLHKSRFAKRAFDILDADSSGEVDFGEFVLGLYNFCTFDNMSLCRFAFDIYDEDSSGFLDHDEIETIVKELYGRRAYKKNKQAQMTVKQIEALEWSVNDNVGAWQIDFPRFATFCRSHPSLLYPAFLMQTALQTRVLGTGFWTVAADNRRRLENMLKCDNNLIEKLQKMHEEDERDFQRGGSRGGVGFADPEESFGEEPALVLEHKSIHDMDRDVSTNSTDASDTPGRTQPPTRLGGINERGSDSIGNSRLGLPTKIQGKWKKNYRERRTPSEKRGPKSKASIMTKGVRTFMSAKKREEKAQKKAMLKEQYKREMRASRRAVAKGRDPEKAAQRAKEKYIAEVKVDAAKKKAAVSVQHAKKAAIDAKDAGAAWKCKRCHHANFATSVCGTCNHPRGMTPSIPTIKSPKHSRRLSRRSTIA